MALTPVQAPSFAGSIGVGKRQNSNNLSLVGFQKPDWEEQLFYETKEYWLQDYLASRGGDGGTTTQETWNWTEVGKAYAQQAVVGATDNGSNNFTVELNTTTQYYIVTDIVMFGIAHPQKSGMNVMLRVESVGTTGGGNQTITGTLVGGVTVGTVVAGDFTGTSSACITNTQVECFELPASKNYSPQSYSNSLMKIANTYNYCDDAANTGMWFKSQSGRFYWVDEEEMIMGWGQHRCRVDGGILWGQDHTATDSGSYTASPGKGIMQFLSEGSLIQTFAASFVEGDLINFITLLATYAKGKEFDLICGYILHRDLLTSLDRYFVGGSVTYGNFKPYPGGTDVGLSVAQYVFGNIKVNIMQYDPFGDPDFLPTGGVNYGNFGMFLNTADNFIKLKYRKDRVTGGKVKDFMSMRHGHSMESNRKTFSSDRACEDRVYTTNVGVTVKGLQSHGLVYPT